MVEDFGHFRCLLIKNHNISSATKKRQTRLGKKKRKKKREGEMKKENEEGSKE